MAIDKAIYTAHATSTGGRAGTTKSSDGRLDATLSTPKELGGDNGPGTNPEQLFAVGYAACFLGAMAAASRKMNIKLDPETTVSAAVSFADREDNVGFGIVAELEGHAPGLSKEETQKLMAAAHEICPYSDLIRNKHDVKLTAV